MAKRIRFAFYICFYTVVLFGANAVLACSCMAPEIATSYTESQSVFIGEVASISQKLTWQNNELLPTRLIKKVDFKVLSAFKGATETDLMVYTENDSAACGFHFEKRQRYLVFAHLTRTKVKGSEKIKENLHVSLCSPTQAVPEDTSTPGWQNLIQQLESPQSDTQSK